MHKETLIKHEVEVTSTTPPSGTNSDTIFSKFGRVAASSCGGAWKYICVVGIDSDGFVIWLQMVDTEYNLVFFYCMRNELRTVFLLAS